MVSKVVVAAPFAMACIPVLAGAQEIPTPREIDMGGGWKARLGLQLLSYAMEVDTDFDGDGAGAGVDSFRILSGFDPSKLQVTISAPETSDGLTISGTFQLVTAITDGKTETEPANQGNLFGVRIAEIAVAGDFGTVKAGRGWQILGSSSLIHNTSSLPGVGGTAVGACGGYTGMPGDTFSGGCGMIGYGYVWTNFASHIQYASNDFGGFSFRSGVFEPLGGSESDSPRFEHEFNYNSEKLDVWNSYMLQDGGADGDLEAFDVGAEARFGGLALTGAYTSGTGISNGFRGPDGDRESDFYYLEADYTHKDVTVGLSYGSHESEPDGGSTDLEGELVTAFLHYKLTPQLTLGVEHVTETVEDGGGNSTFESDHVAVGIQWNVL